MLSFLIGSLVCCALTAMQEILLGFPILVRSLPWCFVFGGGLGVLLYRRHLQQLQASEPFRALEGQVEEQATEFLGKVDEALNDIYTGKITKNFLASMFRALNYDKDIANASEMAEIKGRNANIEANILNKPLSDGLPKVQGGGNVAPSLPERKKKRVEILAETERDRYKS